MEKTNKAGSKIFRIAKVMFASYAIAIGATSLTFTLGSLIFGFENVDEYVFGNIRVLMVVFTIVAIPFVAKYLK